MSDPGPWATPGEDRPADQPPRPPADAPPPPPPGAPPPLPPAVPPPPGQGYGAPPPTARQRVGLVPLYPMGVSDVLDTAFRLLRACAGPAVLLVLVLLGPVQILTSTAFVSPTAILQDPVPEAVDGRLVALSLAGAALSLVVVPLAAAALTWLGAHAEESAVPDWREALRQGARRYWATLGAWALLVLVAVVALVAVGLVVGLLAAAGSGVVAVLVGIPLGLGALVLVVGLTALAYLTVPCVVVEQLGPRRGVARAWQLLRRRFWPTIGVSLAVGLVISLLGGAVSTAISLPALFGIPGAWVFVAIGAILDRLITVPLGAFAALAIHVDQRIRTEGYDVAVLVSELRRPGT
jgi:hypothetical protein